MLGTIGIVVAGVALLVCALAVDTRRLTFRSRISNPRTQALIFAVTGTLLVVNGVVILAS
jgi:hypothetical protein